MEYKYRNIVCAQGLVVFRRMKEICILGLIIYSRMHKV